MNGGAHQGGGRALTPIPRRSSLADEVPVGGGVEAFDTPAALAINKARLDHLASLALAVDDRRVLDVGAGVGHLAQFFVRRGCHVVCVDGREENVRSLSRRYPGLTASVLDVERSPLAPLGRYDVVFCYGLLYHLEGVVAGLRNMASVCDDLLLLETLVCDSSAPVSFMVDEPRVANQALAQLAHRPSPSYIAMALDRVGFRHVYSTRTRPDHPDFRFDWHDDLSIARGPDNLRSIFVASRNELANAALVPLLRD